MVRIFRSPALVLSAARWTKASRCSDRFSKTIRRWTAFARCYALFLARQGKHEEARAQLTEEARGLAKADHDMAYWMASAYAQLGEIDEAFKWLERAIKLGNENQARGLKHDEMLAPMQQDPRFEELMNKIEH